MRSHAYERDALSRLVTKAVFDGENNKPGSSETFSVNFSLLQQDLTSPARFKISVLAMIDWQMKRIDGLDFCRKLRDDGLSIQLVLFTGQASTDMAVQAFNQRAIDGYLVKTGAPLQLAQKINDTIFKHTWQQFVNFGEVLSGLLSHILKPLHDEQFITVFERIREKNQIVEFYLLDSSCSFLMLDADGHAKQLFVRNDADFNDCHEIVKDSKASYEVLQALRGRQMFPYSRESMGYMKFYGDQWDERMVSMDKVPGRELYYSVIDRPDIKAFSFNEYLQEEWPRP